MNEIVFYCFSALLLTSALLVVCLKNAVHSVLFLIFAFLNASALFIMIGAEYIAMTLVIVYVGAVAVLFLFVVMMIENDVAKMKKKALHSLVLASVLCLIVFFEISWAMDQSIEYLPHDQHAQVVDKTNAESIGLKLYTEYFLQFQIVGLILLAAMIGVILLSLNLKQSKITKNQAVHAQVRRRRSEAVVLVDAPFNEGVELR